MSCDTGEILDEGGMLVRDAVINLKKGKTAFCYKEWQVDEIKQKLLKKYNIKISIEKKDNWYWVIKPVKNRT